MEFDNKRHPCQEIISCHSHRFSELWSIKTRKNYAASYPLAEIPGNSCPKEPKQWVPVSQSNAFLLGESGRVEHLEEREPRNGRHISFKCCDGASAYDSAVIYTTWYTGAERSK
jgi:hypothetical protein